ncbi:sigma-54 interaction domain-containing protein [Fusobacterium ulcerans]|uniref:sigma-54 interaction domain-containing protein n=1 Tax=Fusobacterium ulcerans TaxID=861 RepID=UPI001D0A0D39|nr:sigma 54-interacting transcriptional regulator [Fusobacterium ulcerans]MCB8564775.1 sigma 54-interacting transcriptional regulator [Fusobacterium ulcerans]MCB8648843.1 sigma 54-interacting transcriptional regulator [Fusobacterium ulcerans]
MIRNNKFFNVDQDFIKILESSYDGIYITDGEANTLYLNEAYEKMTGIKREELVGKNMKDLVKNKLYDSSGSLLVLQTKDKVSLRQKVVKSNKEILITSTPVFHGEEIIYIVTNVRDISDLSSLQKRLKKVETLNKEYEEALKTMKDQMYGIINNDDVRSDIMLRLVEKILKLAKIDVPLMLGGETGVGKTYFAKYIHMNSQRKDKEFISLNCGAVPKNLIETELFGYVQGAYTGASNKGKTGVFELANGSTIFLDEIAEFDLEMQVKLLKVLEEGEIRRVGSDKNIKVDFRLITASNKDLKQMIKEGKFREDLYYRISAFPIIIPPLRERREDILQMILYFLGIFNEKYNMSKYFSYSALEELKSYSWPGNIRELKNVVEQSLILSNENEIKFIIWNEREDKKSYTDQESEKEDVYIENIERLVTEGGYSLKEVTEKIQRDLIKKMLKKEKKQKIVAKILKVDEATISRKIKDA